MATCWQGTVLILASVALILAVPFASGLIDRRLPVFVLIVWMPVVLAGLFRIVHQRTEPLREN